LAFGIRLKVWGDHACFTRPEMKVERFSYDVMTPSAARGILKPFTEAAIRWWSMRSTSGADPLSVPSAATTVATRRCQARKECVVARRPAGPAASVDEVRQQRAATVLVGPAYVSPLFRAEYRPAPTKTRASTSTRSTAGRCAGQCFNQPASARGIFAASFELSRRKIHAEPRAATGRPTSATRGARSRLHVVGHRPSAPWPPSLFFSAI